MHVLSCITYVRMHLEAANVDKELQEKFWTYIEASFILCKDSNVFVDLLLSTESELGDRDEESVKKKQKNVKK